MDGRELDTLIEKHGLDEAVGPLTQLVQSEFTAELVVKLAMAYGIASEECRARNEEMSAQTRILFGRAQHPLGRHF